MTYRPWRWTDFCATTELSDADSFLHAEGKKSCNIYKIVYVPFSHDLKKAVALKTSDAHASKFTVDVTKRAHQERSPNIFQNDLELDGFQRRRYGQSNKLHAKKAHLRQKFYGCSYSRTRHTNRIDCPL